VSSTATVVAIAIGLAFIPLAGEERPWLRAWPRLRFAANLRKAVQRGLGFWLWPSAAARRSASPRLTIAFLYALATPRH